MRGDRPRKADSQPLLEKETAPTSISNRVLPGITKLGMLPLTLSVIGEGRHLAVEAAMSDQPAAVRLVQQHAERGAVTSDITF